MKIQLIMKRLRLITLMLMSIIKVLNDSCVGLVCGCYDYYEQYCILCMS